MAPPRWSSTLTGSEVYEADCRTVAATLPDGVASLAILDGPYGMSKADWDRVPRGGTLGDLYAGHLDDVGRVCGASASLYLWNTSAGWAELHPLVLARGWEFAGLIVWYKLGAHPARLGAASSSKWPDVIEVAAHYQRGNPTHVNPEGAECVWAYDSTNAMRNGERLFTESAVLRTGGNGRYYNCREPLHPCQKPLLFAERMLRASSRPGDTVWVPFGGTLRELVAAERIARADPGEARRVVTCEINADGRDYIGAALEQVEGRAGVDKRQVQMFGSQP
jgi:DNA modification methylase